MISCERDTPKTKRRVLRPVRAPADQIMERERLRELERNIRKRRGYSLRQERQAAFVRPVKRARTSLLHVWRVQCPGNTHLATLVTSPIKPGFCPVCGGKSPHVMELDAPRGGKYSFV